ncbi:hypothetical protein BHE90_009056 [Fusarium euwallaceae]|uniref:Uncharacterized protein n=2 Tax=Fusarium solani species complex TaxID=232080 RepID=A0A428T7W3_9HYPO|nr:hypothetical protein CEP52_010517 [Fusarium oligoseptatum]RTE76476.1 hypothetical protein BHE90_009056 [Fusarium euwallaceae]
MDKETARKAKDFLARRDVVRLPEPDTVPDIRPEIMPAHFQPCMWPPEAFARYYASIETANKARKDEQEKNNQSPASDVATHGSVADDAQGNGSKRIKRLTREEFQRLTKELKAMDKKERDAMFPHRMVAGNGVQVLNVAGTEIIPNFELMLSSHSDRLVFFLLVLPYLLSVISG